MPKYDEVEMTREEQERLEEEYAEHLMLETGELFLREDRIEHELEVLLATC
ncbi:MAG: hypothetical protein Q4B30_00485 [Coriobacteriaceae bacterium]|nr:hypothetical protein [Coriobacteriaceae bacterium]